MHRLRVELSKDLHDKRFDDTAGPSPVDASADSAACAADSRETRHRRAGMRHFRNSVEGAWALIKVPRRELNRRVALKIVIGCAVAGSTAMRRLLAEAKYRRPCSTEHVQVFDAARTGSAVLFDGVLRTLADVKGEGPAGSAPREAAEIVEQVAKGIAARTSARHRPPRCEAGSNIMLRPDEVARVVMDFGLAKLSESGEIKADDALMGRCSGRPAYMSPEQARAAKDTGRWA